MSLLARASRAAPPARVTFDATPTLQGRRFATQRPDLANNELLDLVHAQGYDAPPKTRLVVVAGVRTYTHTPVSRQGAGPGHGRRVAGVAAARDVRARDELHERSIISQPPGAEAFS